MSKRFIVSFDRSNQEQNNSFLDYIRSKGLGWWHWIENFWLLIDPTDKITAVSLRNKLDELYPGISKLVIELHASGDTWAGYGPNSKDRDMFEWLKNSWYKYR